VFLVRVSREGERLLLQWREPVRHGEEISWLDVQQRELLRGVEAFALAYRAEFDQPWQRVWDQEGSPALVRVGIRANGRYWPDLILAVQR
jgi:general secretion pathway protein J